MNYFGEAMTISKLDKKIKDEAKPYIKRAKIGDYTVAAYSKKELQVIAISLMAENLSLRKRLKENDNG